MSLLFLIPVIVLVMVVILFLYSRKGRVSSGLGDRRDSSERPELRGTEQAKHRPEFGGDGPGNRRT